MVTAKGRSLGVAVKRYAEVYGTSVGPLRRIFVEVHTTAAGKKVALVNLGCAKNLVDAEVMLGKLYERGYELTLDPTQADYLIVNTCGFIQSAKEESIEHILEMAQIKAQDAQKKLVVTGCLAQRYGNTLLQEM